MRILFYDKFFPIKGFLVQVNLLISVNHGFTTVLYMLLNFTRDWYQYNADYYLILAFCWRTE